MLVDDPIDRLVAIAATWDRACAAYVLDTGGAVATAAYLEWATENGSRRVSFIKDEIAKMRLADERRFRGTDGAFAVRLLYGWRAASGDAFYNESDIVTPLLKSLGTPDSHPRTMVRLLTALARFGVVDRIVGVRSRETQARLSQRGVELYEEFCLRCSTYVRPSEQVERGLVQ